MLTNHVKRYREAAHVSLRHLGDAVGADPGFLSRIERNHDPCPDALKLKLARFFGVGVGDLFFQTKEPANAGA